MIFRVCVCDMDMAALGTRVHVYAVDVRGMYALIDGVWGVRGGSARTNYLRMLCI